MNNYNSIKIVYAASVHDYYEHTSVVKNNSRQSSYYSHPLKFSEIIIQLFSIFLLFGALPEFLLCPVRS